MDTIKTSPRSTSLLLGTVSALSLLCGADAMAVDYDLNVAVPGAVADGDTLYTTAAGAHYASALAGLPLIGTLNIDTGNLAGAQPFTWDGVFNGAGGLNKVGLGALTLDVAANTYTGGTTITAGSIVVSFADALPAPGAGPLQGAVNIAAGAALTLNAVDQTIGDLSGAAGANVDLGANVLTFGTAIASTTYAGVIQGAGGSLVKDGAGIAILSGVNTYDAGTTINAGTLGVAGAAPLGAAGGDLTFGAAGVTLKGVADATIANDITLDATAAVGSNLIQALPDTALTLSGVIQVGLGGFTLGGGGTVNLTGVNLNTNAAIEIADGTTVGIDNAASFGAVGTATAISLTGSSTIDSTAAAAPLVLPAAKTFAIAANTLTFNVGAQPLTVTGAIADAAAGGSLSKTGAGSLILVAANPYAGGTVLNEGTIQVQDPAGLGAGALTFATNDGNILQAGAAINIANPITLTNSGVVDVNGNNLTLSGAISGPGGLSVIDTGAGADLTLTAANTFGGTLTIGQAGAANLTKVVVGPALVAPATVLPTTTPVLLNGQGALDIAGAGNITVGSLSDANGNNSIVLGANTLTVNQAGNTVFAGNIGSDGAGGGFTKAGAGNLTLTGDNALTGHVIVNQGTLTMEVAQGANVFGAAAGVDINAGATLAGTGDIAGNLTNAGTLSLAPYAAGLPSSTVGGNYTQNGGTFVLNITPGGYSQLNVAGADLTGGTLDFNIAPGVNLTGQVYTFITSVAPVATQFALVPKFIGTFKSNVTYTANAVVAAPALVSIQQEISGSGATSTETTMAQYIDSLPTSAKLGDLGQVMQALSYAGAHQRNQGLEDISSAEVGAESVLTAETSSMVNSITGVRLAGLRNYMGASGGRQAAGFAAGSGKRSLGVINQLQSQNITTPQETYHTTRAGLASDFDHQMQQSIALCRGKGGVWAQGFGNVAKQSNHKGDRGYKADTGGFMAGVDYRLNQNVFVGAGAGVSSNDIKWKENGGKARIRGYFGTVYGTFYSGGFYVDGSLVGGQNRYKTRRHIGIGAAIDRTATSRHDGYEFTPHLGAGYEIDLQQAIVEPFVGVDYTFMHQDGYKETGANSLNLTVKGESSQMLRGELGFNVFKTLAFQGGNWTPKAKLSYILKEPTKKDKTKGAFQGQSTFFAVESYKWTRNQVSPGLGVTFRFNSGMFVDARYDAEIDSSSSSHEVGLKVGMAF